MYQLGKLKTIPGLVHGFSEISDGNMSFEWGDGNSVIDNRYVFLAKLDVSQKDCVITRTRHAHGTDIEIVRTESKGRGTQPPLSDEADIDAMLTGDKNIFLGILTADCLPAIIYEPCANALTLAHLSRINSPRGFARKIVEKMKNEHGAKPENMIVGIGPCIHKESYVFGAEEFKKTIPDEKIFGGFINDLPGGKKSVDIVGYNVNELISAGVLVENIEICPADAVTDKNFFSHRRSRLTGEKEGRMITVAGMTS